MIYKKIIRLMFYVYCLSLSEVSGDDHEEDMESDNSEDNSGEESTPNGDNHAPSASTTSSSSSNSLSGGTAPGKNTAKRPPRLFSLSVVNSYGSAEMDVVKDDNKSIPVTCKNQSFNQK